MPTRIPPTYVSWLPKAGDQVVSIADIGSGYRVYADRAVGANKVLVEYQFDRMGRYVIDKKVARRDTSSITAGTVDTVTFSQESLDLVREYNSNNEIRKLTDSSETGGLNLVKNIVQVDNAGLYKMVGGNGQREAYVVGKARQEMVAIPNDRITVTRYRKDGESFIVDGNGSYILDAGNLSITTRYKYDGAKYLVDPNGAYALDPNNPSGPRYSDVGGTYVADQYGNFAVNTSGPTRFKKTSANGSDVYTQDPAGTYIEDKSILRYAKGSLQSSGFDAISGKWVEIYNYVQDPNGSYNSDGSTYVPKYIDGGAPSFSKLTFTKLNFTPIGDDLLNLRLKSDFTDAATLANSDTTNFVKFDQDGATPLVFLTSEISINGKGGVTNFKTNATTVKRLAEDVKMVASGPVDRSTGLQNVLTARLNGQKLGGGVDSSVLIYALDLSGKYVGSDANNKAVDVFKDSKGKDLSLSAAEKGLTSSAILFLNKDQTLWQPPSGTSVTKYRQLGSRIILNLSSGGSTQYAIFNTSGVLTKLSTSSVWA